MGGQTNPLNHWLFFEVRMMKRQILTLLLFSILLPACSQREDIKAIVSPEPKSHAWSLRITFIPAGKELYGIPIKKIDPTWAFAAQMKKEVIPHDVLFEEGQDSMARNGLDFVQKGDFNNDNIEDIALVGVYQDSKQQDGMFFLILTKTRNGSWEKAFLEFFPGKPGFLGLQGDGHNLALAYCMECDGVSDITWDKKLKTYRIEDSADVDM
jgi:hypothetical protein